MSSTLNFKTIQVRFHFLSFLNNPVTFSVYLRIIHSMKKKSPHIIILFLAFLLALGYGTGYLGQKLQEEGSFGFFQKKSIERSEKQVRSLMPLWQSVAKYLLPRN
jgi:hypothetical protein